VDSRSRRQRSAGAAAGGRGCTRDVALELLDGGGQAAVALALLAVGLGVLQRRLRRVQVARELVAQRAARPRKPSPPLSTWPRVCGAPVHSLLKCSASVRCRPDVQFAYMPSCVPRLHAATFLRY